MDDFWKLGKDPLGEVLHYLRMSGTFYCRSEFSAPFGLTLPPIPECVWFHIVTSGSCWLVVEGNVPQLLQQGDMALVPHGNGHVLNSQANVLAPIVYDLPSEAISDCYEILRHGGGGAITSMVCGAVRFDHPVAKSLVELLPGIIYLEATHSLDQTWMHSTLQLITAEAKAMLPGGEAVMTRLSDILVIQAIRFWITQHASAQTGWLGALQDKQIGKAMSLIHRYPARDWTVASLAHEIAMSRSAFAARFAELASEPVMHYVTRWRMNVALSWLKEDVVTVAELANRLGYQSEAAFSRAFKRTIGVSPGAVKRTTSVSQSM